MAPTLTELLFGDQVRRNFRNNNLGLRSTLKPQGGKICFIVKSGIGLGDLRLSLL